VPIVREYFAETGQWTYLGTGLECPGMAEFLSWVDERHPEMAKEGGQEGAGISAASKQNKQSAK